MTDKAVYFDLVNRLFGFMPDSDGMAPIGELDKYGETPSEALALLEKKGIEAVSFADPGDSYFGIYEDGELKLSAYISTRGSLYQAGAFDGTLDYFNSNFRSDGAWHEGNSTCGNIARTAWELLENPDQWGKDDA